MKMHPKDAEEEVEKLKAENLSLKEAVEKHRLELDARNRELKLEASLERVRAKAMAMRRSEELDEVLEVLFDQFDVLGIHPMSTHMTIIDLETNSFTFRETGKGGRKSFGEQKVPIDSMDIWKEAADRWRTTEPLSLNKLHFPKESLPVVWQVFHESFASMPEGHKIYPEDYPDGIYHTAGNCQFGYLGMNQVRKATEEEEQIVLKFAIEFGRLYQRYLDLQKAEAQTREAKIEAALERVRSSSLAMQKTIELKDVVNVVFENFRSLGLKNIDSVNININHPDTKEFDLWIAAPGENYTRNFRLPYLDHPITNDFFKAIEKEETLHRKIYGFDVKNKFFSYMFENSDNKYLPDERKKLILAGPAYAVSAAIARYSSIFIHNYSGIPFSDDDNSILMRFATVFDQTYTRFLDLKKVEAQARESQIQLALERVRARTMAMQHSNELADTATVLFEQFAALGDAPERVAIEIVNEEERVFEIWATQHGGKQLNLLFKISFDEPHVMQKMYRAWQDQVKSITIDLQGQALEEYFRYLDEHRIPVQREKFGTRRVQNVATFSKGILTIITPEPRPKETIRLLERFAGVFEQTYTRFLDLQKAEAQAKEAQVEASLERVRGKAMAMHSSQDLAKTIAAFYNELEIFSITPRRCGVGLLNKETRIAELSTMNTTDAGDSIEIIGRLKMIDHPVLEGIYENWLLQKEYHPVLRGAEIPAYYKLVRPQIPFPDYPDDAVQYGYFFFFPEGGVYAWTDKEMAEDELNIYRRFTSVLSLTYKRYKDLQQAEDLAKQAEDDLVKLKEEKKKTEEALTELKNTQSQLVQSEKMASLGELTAGIAHEIQNPLNFVNNFSEVSNELLDEMIEEVSQGNYEEVKAIADNVKQNLEKIYHHGKRADSIVKGMLQHSRSSSGQKEPTDINVLADEYLRLAFHGLRAKDKSFNAGFKTDLDESIGKIEVVPQDFGRVLVNLLNNAFYAVNEKKKREKSSYEPMVTLSTKNLNDRIEVRVTDNGNGIHRDVLEKIFQPFFTTKPTGQGTGLGLSLSYDIIKAHGGELKVETKEGEGSVFIIHLPG